jgi:DNA repair photolyase
MRSGIRRTRKFEEKGLAQFAVNVGIKRGHGCSYCSTGAMLRRHPSFRAAGENPFAHGYAIVDPDIHERDTRDAASLRNRGLVCTSVDAWSPEAQQLGLGRRCLSAILAEPGWTIRILTKNAAVANDFGLIKKHRDRVLVGLSLTATSAKSQTMAVVEPYASPISEGMSALRDAHRRGLRTYGMLCPLPPGISDSSDQIDELVQFVLGCGVEEVFVEPVNARGLGLSLTEQVLRAAGYRAEADEVGAIGCATQDGQIVSHGVAPSSRQTGGYSGSSGVR